MLCRTCGDNNPPSRTQGADLAISNCRSVPMPRVTRGPSPRSCLPDKARWRLHRPARHRCRGPSRRQVREAGQRPGSRRRDRGMRASCAPFDATTRAHGTACRLDGFGGPGGQAGNALCNMRPNSVMTSAPRIRKTPIASRRHGYLCGMLQADIPGPRQQKCKGSLNFRGLEFSVKADPDRLIGSSEKQEAACALLSSFFPSPSSSP